MCWPLFFGGEGWYCFVCSCFGLLFEVVWLFFCFVRSLFVGFPLLPLLFLFAFAFADQFPFAKTCWLRFGNKQIMRLGARPNAPSSRWKGLDRWWSLLLREMEGWRLWLVQDQTFQLLVFLKLLGNWKFKLFYQRGLNKLSESCLEESVFETRSLWKHSPYETRPNFLGKNLQVEAMFMGQRFLWFILGFHVLGVARLMKASELSHESNKGATKMRRSQGRLSPMLAWQKKNCYSSSFISWGSQVEQEGSGLLS